ncbi:MAG TPA: hypothetical protein PK109_02590 [Candidatus Paceibacterota bacterium]|nr:hypothetical protein [Candidatus Paceibacterota bacterium]
MATIINTPPTNDTGNSATIWVLGLIIIVLIGLFAFFVWPGMDNQAAAPTPIPTEERAATPQQPNVYNTTINATSTTVNGTTTLP